LRVLHWLFLLLRLLRGLLPGLRWLSPLRMRPSCLLPERGGIPSPLPLPLLLLRRRRPPPELLRVWCKPTWVKNS
jgi:hypothetical protein